MSAQHTQGPWVAIFPDSRQKHEGTDITMYEVMSEKTRKQLREDGFDHYDRHNEDVANVSIVSNHFWRDMSDDEAKANARLIAAAPEMLDALLDIVRRNEIQNWFNVDKARAAIAKATGGAA